MVLSGWFEVPVPEFDAVADVEPINPSLLRLISYDEVADDRIALRGLDLNRDVLWPGCT